MVSNPHTALQGRARSDGEFEGEVGDVFEALARDHHVEQLHGVLVALLGYGGNQFR